jgi:uncharacterized membrane protein
MSWFARVAAVGVIAAIEASTPSAPAYADDLSDADVVALVRKHCVPCHAQMPSHPAFDKPPRNLALETLDQIKRNAARIKEQVVEDRDMPLGNETGMTDDERGALGRWIAALK